MLTAQRALVVTLLLLLPVPQASTQSTAGPITTPQQQFGASIGDDYFLATYTQLEEYWKKLDRESDRMQLVDIGRTEEGRVQWMAVISAPENLAKLDRYKDISRRLSLAEGLTDDQARALASEGKAVVWIDGGLHANEVLGAQQLIETVYQLVSRSDVETLRFLRDVIVLAVHANPDGHELVANWYMREREPMLRTLSSVPRAYQKYIGHDNNRDFYMSTQAETINMNRILYKEWFPQIVYDHHQTGPAGTVMFAPPFRDPFNFLFDPLIPSSIDLVGAAMHARFALEGKPGVTMRRGSTYSTWWNGGLRTTAYFHNQIGLLTESIGSPTPIEIPFVPDKQLPSADLPYPIAPQRWHFRQSIEYSVTANRAVIDAASRYRETLLFNIYAMGRNAVARGNQDTWTFSPRRLASVRPNAATRGSLPSRVYEQLKTPQSRDPRGYILSADQPDFLTATKFVDALLRTGVAVHRATAAFAVNGRTYPAGSFVVKTAQAFRPHVLDMFEPQDHPDDIPYPGGTPIAALRQRRLDARVSDGREVRSRARRLRRSLRARDDRIASGRTRRRCRAAGGLSGQSSSERRLRRRQSAAESGRDRVLAGRSPHWRRGRWTRCDVYPAPCGNTGAAPESGGGSWAHVHGRRGAAAGPGAPTAACSHRLVGSSTAGRARVGGCAGSSSASSSPSTSSTRRRSMPAISRAASM